MMKKVQAAKNKYSATLLSIVVRKSVDHESNQSIMFGYVDRVMASMKAAQMLPLSAGVKGMGRREGDEPVPGQVEEDEEVEDAEEENEHDGDEEEEEEDDGEEEDENEMDIEPSEDDDNDDDDDDDEDDGERENSY